MKDVSYFQRICEFSLQFTIVLSNIEMNPPPPPNSHFMIYSAHYKLRCCSCVSPAFVVPERRD